MKRLLFSATLLLGGLPVGAQQAPAPPPPKPSPPAISGTVSILILALDDLATSSTNLPFLAPEAPPTTVTPPAIAPMTVPAPALAPTATQHGLKTNIQTFAFAQQKPKVDKEAALFAPLPDRPTTPLVPPSGNASPQGAFPVTPPAPAPAEALPPVAPPLGRAGLTAISLRRAIVARGFTDVQTASPESPIIARAMLEKRLSIRVIDDLKRAMFALSAPGQPTPATLSAATRAGSRIGQAVGYRAVVALYVGEPTGQTEKNSGFTLFWSDSQNEVGEPIAFDEKGATEAGLRETGALTASALLIPALQALAPVSPTQRAQLAQKHFLTARGAFEAGRIPIAIDEINQAISLDGVRADFFVLQGQILEASEPAASVAAFRRAVELNAKDGETWAKLARGYTYATTPNWPSALGAARKAIDAGYDSSDLRVAMATAEYGRATLFRRADRLDRAEDAEAQARIHLDRALELSPDNPAAIRILAKTLLANRAFSEALQTLDRVAPRFPRDVELQTLYASSLAGLPTSEERQEDAFTAAARVWKLTGKTQVDLDAATYRTLAEGFDQRVSNLGRTASTLTSGVAAGTLAQESAFLQLTKLTEEMKSAQEAINAMRLPAGVNADAITARQYAADLMTQALEAQSTFLETGQRLYRERGLSLTQNAITQLNAARTAG